MRLINTLALGALILTVAQAASAEPSCHEDLVQMRDYIDSYRSIHLGNIRLYESPYSVSDQGSYCAGSCMGQDNTTKAWYTGNCQWMKGYWQDTLTLAV